jgi:hypothetical protein
MVTDVTRIEGCVTCANVQAGSERVQHTARVVLDDVLMITYAGGSCQRFRQAL